MVYKTLIRHRRHRASLHIACFHLVVRLLLILFCAAPRAAETTVAVASNFLDTANALKAGFESTTGHALDYVTGSTGKLYAQITSGAPFDVLLAADQTTVQQLIDARRAVAETRFTYALGGLVLWSATPGRVTDPPAELLQSAALRHLAIANPEVAPYGAATVAALKRLDLWNDVRDNVVYGQNINDVFVMVATGNATAGFVAASALIGNTQGSRWPVPSNLHPPLAQEAVLLRAGVDNPAASAYLAYLRSADVRAVIAARGYAVLER